MGIDYGLKYLGIAITDTMHIIASPFGTIEGGLSLKKDALKILEIAESNNVSTIVFGMPINMNGSKGKMAVIVHNLVDMIKSISNIKIVTIDERLTTVQAEKILISNNTSRNKRKNLKNKISAALILQTYLNMFS
jgi:putative Holliday junction resolvase